MARNPSHSPVENNEKSPTPTPTPTTPDGPMSSVMEPVRVSANIMADYEITVKLLEEAKEFRESAVHINLRRLLADREEAKKDRAQHDLTKQKLLLTTEHLEDLEAKLDKQGAMKQMRVVPGRSSSREAFVSTGAIVLSDGTRLCLRHIASYRLGGGEIILFYGSQGDLIGTWNPPKELQGPQHEKKLAQTRKQVLGALDDIFAVERED